MLRYPTSDVTCISQGISLKIQDGGHLVLFQPKYLKNQARYEKAKTGLLLNRQIIACFMYIYCILLFAMCRFVVFIACLNI